MLVMRETHRAKAARGQLAPHVKVLFGIHLGGAALQGQVVWNMRRCSTLVSMVSMHGGAALQGQAECVWGGVGRW